MYEPNRGKFRFEKNLINSNTWKWKIAETVVVVAISNSIITAIPFVPTVDSIVRFTTTLFLGGFFLKGIEEQSVLQRIICEIKFKKQRRELHLRSAEYVRKTRKKNSAGREDQSLGEHYIEKADKWFRGIIEKESEDE